MVFWPNIDTQLLGIINITPAGVITRFNHAAEIMFGWTAQEVIGQNIKLLMPEKYSKDHDVYLQNYLTTGVRKGILIFNSNTHFE